MAKAKAKPKATEPKSASSRSGVQRRSGRKTVKKDRGVQLFDHVCRMTGIPSDKIKSDLTSILERKNLDVQDLTLDQLRNVAATYLREIMGGLLDRKANSGN